ncbi:MAG: hypothetical protein WC783_01445 [Candidatus Paceibacterota bacterium]|jgi:hypothetical protein
MINLIPNEEKKIKVKDFYFRFFVLSILAIAVSFCVASIVLIPSYYVSSIKKDLITEKLFTLKNTPSPNAQETNSTLNLFNAQLSLVENAQKDKFIITEKVVNEIILKKMPDIRITGISYEKNSEIGGKIVNVRGIARSRERLLLFRNILEGDTLFKKIDLPISNFVKGSNISFSISLIPS